MNIVYTITALIFLNQDEKYISHIRFRGCFSAFLKVVDSFTEPEGARGFPCVFPKSTDIIRPHIGWLYTETERETTPCFHTHCFPSPTFSLLYALTSDNEILLSSRTCRELDL